MNVIAYVPKVVHLISRKETCLSVLILHHIKNNSSSVYDCTVEDVEYIYNKLSIHIFNSKSNA